MLVNIDGGDSFPTLEEGAFSPQEVKDNKYLEFLYNYYNPTINMLMANLMKINRRLGIALYGKDYLKDNGLKFYTMTNINGKNYLVDDDGRMQKLKKAIPRYLRGVK